MARKSTQPFKNSVNPDSLPKPVAPILTGENPVERPAASGVKRIKLLYAYRGSRTAERVIAPGVYPVDDPELFGLADYLVLNGHAEEID